MKGMSTTRLIIVCVTVVIVAVLASQVLHVNITNSTNTQISPGGDAKDFATANLIDQFAHLVDDLRTGAAINKLFGEWIPGLFQLQCLIPIIVVVGIFVLLGMLGGKRTR